MTIFFPAGTPDTFEEISRSLEDKSLISIAFVEEKIAPEGRRNFLMVFFGIEEKLRKFWMISGVR